MITLTCPDCGASHNLLYGNKCRCQCGFICRRFECVELEWREFLIANVGRIWRAQNWGEGVSDEQLSYTVGKAAGGIFGLIRSEGKLVRHIGDFRTAEAAREAAQADYAETRKAKKMEMN